MLQSHSSLIRSFKFLGSVSSRRKLHRPQRSVTGAQKGTQKFIFGFWRVPGMGTEHSRPSGHGEKDRGGKNRYATSSTTVGSDGRPDLPSTGFSKFSKALQAWMRADVDNLEKLTSLINTESYTVSGKTIDSVKDEKNHTALHFAVLAQKPHIVKYLLECGCQARTLNDSWQTALHDAIDLGNHDIVMLLLEFGAPNVCLSTNGLGELPIHTVRICFKSTPTIKRSLNTFQLR